MCHQFLMWTIMSNYIDDFQNSDMIWNPAFQPLNIDKLDDHAKQVLAFNEVYKTVVDNDVEEYIRSVCDPYYGKKRNGRKCYDPVFMIKLSILQRMCGHNDELMAGLLHHEGVIQYVLGIYSDRKLPSRRTIWKYNELFRKHKVDEYILELVNKKVIDECKTGIAVAIDSSFVEAPKQRNKRQENEQIKQGHGNELWHDNQDKKSHKDIDGSWTKKRGVSYYGYKLHAKIDEDTKLILKHTTTTAKVADNSQISKLIDASDYGFICHADSGYLCKKNSNGKSVTDELTEKYKIDFNICERPKGKNKTYTEAQKLYNLTISPARCRVEHVFGYMEGCMGGLKTWSVGMARAKYQCNLMVAIYNMCRFAQLLRYNDYLINNLGEYQELNSKLSDILGDTIEYDSDYIPSTIKYADEYLKAISNKNFVA